MRRSGLIVGHDAYAPVGGETAMSVVRTSTSGGSFVAQTFSAAPDEPVIVTSITWQAFQAANYTFGIDNDVYVTKAAASDEFLTWDTSDFGGPLLLDTTARNWWFSNLAGNQRYHFRNSVSNPPGWTIGQWQEAPGNQVPVEVDYYPARAVPVRGGGETGGQRAASLWRSRYADVQVGANVSVLSRRTDTSSGNFSSQTFDVIPLYPSLRLVEALWRIPSATSWELRVDGQVVDTQTGSPGQHITFAIDEPFDTVRELQFRRVDGGSDRGWPYRAGVASVENDYVRIEEWQEATGVTPAVLLTVVPSDVGERQQ